jgi:hypothetical protein
LGSSIGSNVARCLSLWGLNILITLASLKTDLLEEKQVSVYFSIPEKREVIEKQESKTRDKQEHNEYSGCIFGLNTTKVTKTTLGACSVSCFTCSRHAICLRLLFIVGGRLL